MSGPHTEDPSGVVEPEREQLSDEQLDTAIRHLGQWLDHEDRDDEDDEPILPGHSHGWDDA
jgi:hypothetical protein